MDTGLLGERGIAIVIKVATLVNIMGMTSATRTEYGRAMSRMHKRGGALL